jgi:hypothetical protein
MSTDDQVLDEEDWEEATYQGKLPDNNKLCFSHKGIENE